MKCSFPNCSAVLALAFLVALLSGSAAAQDEPPPSSVPPPAVAWEPMGLDSFEVRMLLFAEGPAPDGSLDTLYTTDHGGPRPDIAGPHRLPPGGEWSVLVCVFYPAKEGCGPEIIAQTASGVILIGSSAGPIRVRRSADSGETWEKDVLDEHVGCLYAASEAFDRAAFACEWTGTIWRSDHDGAAGTWEQLGFPDPEGRGFGAFALAEALPGPALPAPRLIAAVAGGMSYSDDGGETWTRSALWQGFRYWSDGGIARHAIDGHPYGGVLYVGIRDGGFGWPTVYASEDGGETWALRSGGPDMTETRFNRGVVAADSSGGVWVGTSWGSLISGTSWGTVVWSGDGARTWADVGAGLPEVSVNHLLFGRDGRLYAATDKGVWRTTNAVAAVADEDGLEAPSSNLGLRVFPNPTGGAATVALRLAAPERVRVSVVDMQGREVARVHDGPAADGQRVVIETADLPAGSYLVRATTASGAAATAGLTVAR